MLKITNYKIVKAKKATDLELLVLDKIKEGWQPFNTPFQRKEQFNDIEFIYQVMVQYDLEDNEKFVESKYQSYGFGAG